MGTGIVGPRPTGPRFCWLLDSSRYLKPVPGLLLEWRRTERADWEGLVLLASKGGPDEWTFTQRWVAAPHLSAGRRG